MVKGSCHCGAVKTTYNGEPKALVRCNCSICSRLGVLWGHGTDAVISITATKNATISYVWGDKDIAFHSCKTCGCTTHWRSTRDESPNRMALNMLLVPAQDRAHLPVRDFDGADSWAFLN
jgi:hypothetical protein